MELRCVDAPVADDDLTSDLLQREHPGHAEVSVLAVANARKSRSRMPAPTVVIQGAMTECVELPGPTFPAEQDTRTFCSMPANAPMATLSLE
jgi:hypothetical protein